MNNSVNIFRRLLKFRSCNRIIGSSYCDGRKNDEKSDGKKFTSPDSSTEPQIQMETNTKNVNLEASPATMPESNAPISSLDTPGEKNVASDSRSGEKLGGGPEKEENIRKSNITSDGDGFLAAYNKQTQMLKEAMKPKKPMPQSSETFASMLRKSAFIDLGDAVGKLVVGEIYLIVNNDLYIDFGWKFHAVCPIPRKNSEKYTPGAKVLLRIKDLELSAKFLGEQEYVSLLEADCDIVTALPPKARAEQNVGTVKHLHKEIEVES